MNNFFTEFRKRLLTFENDQSRCFRRYTYTILNSSIGRFGFLHQKKANLYLCVNNRIRFFTTGTIKKMQYLE